MVYGKQGGRHPDPGMAAVCGRCDEPRGAHGGKSHLGNCPDQKGLKGRRFSLRDEDKPERPTELPPPTGTPIRMVRFNDSLWERFGEVAGDRSAVIRQFAHWFVGDEGWELPARPEQQVPVGED